MAQKIKKNRGLSISRYYTKEGISPFKQFEFENRSSIIRNPNGEIVFEMNNVEVPKKWSQVATDILAQKYFRKAGVPLENGKTGGETSIKQVAHRLANCWMQWGKRYNYFNSDKDAQVFYDESVYMLLGQHAAPNSPQWFNTGLFESYNIKGKPQGHFFIDPITEKLKQSTSAYERPVPHACFILSVDDDLVNEGGIMDLWMREARIFKYGSGTGTNFSKIRGSGETLSGGGTSSGIMSFLKIGDRAAGAIKSGGTTRRAAKMVCLDLDHPEIMGFINWKVEEERKVAALIKAGYASDYEGEAYSTVSGQNSNNSVRVPNSFFEILEKDGLWETKARTDGRVMSKIPAKEVWQKIAFAAWACADPGVQYDTTIQEWHTCPADGKINASNPCVTGDTYVTTHKGLEKIENLIGQTRGIKSIDGNIHWVENIFATGTKPVYELTTNCGYRLKLTADHRIFTENKGDIPASELSKDDILRLVQGNFGDQSCGSEEIAQLIGLLLGDGSITSLNEMDASGEQRRAANLTMGKMEKEIVEWANETINQLRPQWSEHNKQSAVVETNTTYRTTIGSPRLLKQLEKFAVLAQGSENKILTDASFQLNKQEQASLLRGLFTADGTVANYGEKSQYIALDSTSYQLLHQIQLLLLNFGIKAKLYENRRVLGNTTTFMPDGKGGKKEYPVKQIHSLRISRNSRLLFEKQIGFMPQSQKCDALKQLNQQISTYKDKLIDYVAEMKFVGMEPVYDLTEPITHHFIANGIAVHNCSEYMFLDNTACNLASLNLMRFFNEKNLEFDIAGFEHASRLWTIILEISVLMAQFPSKEIAELSYKFRTLGLGFANLGSLLMVSGIAYDSPQSLAISGAISAIMSGISYSTSAEMAKYLGSFKGYTNNSATMLKVMRNHRFAAYNAMDAYEGLSVQAQGIDPKYCPDYLLKAATNAWDQAVQLGEKYGYRNAQTTVIAPTGTIGLIMDCDTTGVEPDFALVKFKKLSGGGYFKIINQSILNALKTLNYSNPEIDQIIDYVMGKATFKSCPVISADTLKTKGFTQTEINFLERHVKSSFDINFVFNPWTLGDGCLQRLGFKPEQYNAPGFNLLKSLGFTLKQIAEANDYVCGTMTIEGAPFLKEEHYPVFDCANKCGRKGQRFIHPHGHIRMMAAVQPFISGAISKTINLPNESTVDDIKNCYEMSWKMGLKATALYRDGCKLSQPLSSRSDSKDEEESDDNHNHNGNGQHSHFKVTDLTPEIVLEAASRIINESKNMDFHHKLSRIRKKLPSKRRGFTQKAKIAGQTIFVRTGEYEDGTLGEIFIDMHKEGASFRSLMNCFAIAVSLGMQYGVPLEEFISRFTFTRFEPAGRVEHENIKSATSVVDYIFRLLAFEYLGREDLVQVPPKKMAEQIAENPTATNDEIRNFSTETQSPKKTKPHTSKEHEAKASEIALLSATQEYLANMSGDAPTCYECGHITVRSGVCYKCLNCGTSMGCS